MNQKNKLDVLSMLSPQQEEVLKIQNELSKNSFSTVGVSNEELRANYTKERAYWNEGGPVMVEKRDILVKCRDKEISVRILKPNNKPINKCLFYIHGGGFVVGNNDTHERIMRILASQSDSIVIGIDYTLSPEAKYPTALLECVDVFCYFQKNAMKYGVDENHLGFAGDSCGAHLAFSTLLYMRDNKIDISGIKAMLLYYGLYGLRTGTAFKLYGGSWDGVTEEDIAYYMDQYIENKEDMEAPYVNVYNNDLTYGIPPCFIVSAQLDPLVDDSTALYKIIHDKGIVCEYKEYKGALHAFLHYSKIMDDSNEALQLGASYFKNIK